MKNATPTKQKNSVRIIWFLSLVLFAIGNLSLGTARAVHTARYVDIDNEPKANIDYQPVFVHKTPDQKRQSDTLKFNRNNYSVFRLKGIANEPLGNFNVFTFSFFNRNKPLFSEDSVFIQSPVQVSMDSTEYTFSILQDLDGEKSPYGDIVSTDIKTKNS